MFRRLFQFGILMAVTLFIAGITYFCVSYITAPTEKPVSAILSRVSREENGENVYIDAGTLIRKEKEYACGDKMTDFQGPAPTSMQGMSLEDLEKKYPPQEGWEVEKLDDRIVILSKSTGELCEQHSQFRHLGVHKGMVAVYKGPLGYNGELLRVEYNLPLENLPENYRDKLDMVMNYEKQKTAVKLDLKEELEFSSERELNTVLDTLDELRDM